MFFTSNKVVGGQFIGETENPQDVEATARI